VAARPEVSHFYIGDVGPRFTALDASEGEDEGGAQLAGLVTPVKAASSCRARGSRAREKGPRWADLVDDVDTAEEDVEDASHQAECTLSGDARERARVRRRTTCRRVLALRKSRSGQRRQHPVHVPVMPAPRCPI
jgi:hypothetical protein